MGSGSLHHSALLSYNYVALGHVGVCILVFLCFLDSKTEILSWRDCLLLPTSSQRGRELAAQAPGSEMTGFRSLFLSLFLQVQSRTDEEPWPHAWLCVRHQRTETKPLLRIFPACCSPWMLKKTVPAATFTLGWVQVHRQSQQELDSDTWKVPRYLQSVSASGAVKTSRVRQVQIFPDAAHDCYLVSKSLLL